MPDKSRSFSHQSWAIPTAVGIVAIALVAYIVWGNAVGSEPAATSATVQATTDADVAPSPDSAAGGVPPTDVDEPGEMTLADAERRDPDDLLAVGPVDAPVVLVVFADYQCQFCARWSDQSLPSMMEYVDDGELRIEWRDVNVYGRDSERAARAAYAAALQDRFWDYHHALYPDGAIRSTAGLTEDSLVETAQQLNLDVPQFRSAMNDDATVAAVTRNQELGIGLGAFSTPFFVMGGQPIVGAQPTEVFVDAFEQALAAEAN